MEVTLYNDHRLSQSTVVYNPDHDGKSRSFSNEDIDVTVCG